MKRLKLIVAYDGTNYCGWQVQPGVATIEGELNKALSRLTGEDIQVIGASRTDAGVHAFGNVAVFDSNTPIPGDKMMFALNPHLPEDIRVVDSCEVATDFHPRYCDTRKTYEYHIYQSPYKNPKERLYSTFVYSPLDLEKMNEGAKAFVGTHDFAAFCAAGSSVSTTVRTIFDCHVEQEGPHIRILVTGDGFLYNMVRILAGTLIAVGQGKIPAEKVAEIIAGKDRRQAGQTAEPQGLTLREIYYDLP